MSRVAADIRLAANFAEAARAIAVASYSVVSATERMRAQMGWAAHQMRTRGMCRKRPVCGWNPWLERATNA